MSAASTPVTVNILDRDYLVACEPDEKAGLMAAASLLDGRMRELRTLSRNASAERVAVMAALTLAHEYLSITSNSRVADGSLSESLQSLQRKLDTALSQFLQ